MPVKIIDSKKVLMTEDEWKMYEDICKSYDNPPSQKGKDLFTGLFETDDQGIIIYLRPPHTRMCSFEVYLFLMGLMQHQHLRIGHKVIAGLSETIDGKIKELKILEDRIDEKLKGLDSKKEKK